MSILDYIFLVFIVWSCSGPNGEEIRKIVHEECKVKLSITNDRNFLYRGTS